MIETYNLMGVPIPPLTMLPPLEKQPRPEAEWPATGANAWLLKERYVEAAAMERAARISDIPAHRRRAS